MSIIKLQSYRSNGQFCYEVDEFANDGLGQSYPIDCQLLHLPTERIATLPSADWITSALNIYFYHIWKQENLAEAALLNIDISEYIILYPERDENNPICWALAEEYIQDNWPSEEDTQAFVDFIRSLEIGI